MSNWLASEDFQLCISYMHVSIDPFTGNKKKVDKLLEKIYANYIENWVIGHGESTKEDRTQIAISSRFTELKPVFNLWGETLSYARRNPPPSGTSPQDQLRKAQMWFVSKTKKEFSKFECWEVVETHHILGKPWLLLHVFTTTKLLLIPLAKCLTPSTWMMMRGLQHQ